MTDLLSDMSSWCPPSLAWRDRNRPIVMVFEGTWRGADALLSPWSGLRDFKTGGEERLRVAIGAVRVDAHESSYLQYLKLSLRYDNAGAQSVRHGEFERREPLVAVEDDVGRHHDGMLMLMLMLGTGGPARE